MDLSDLIKGIKPEEAKEMNSILPKGEYDVLIEKVEARKNDKGWKALNFQLRVISELYNNAVLFDLVTIANSNSSDGAQKGVEIGKMRLARIANLVGTADTTKMLGKTMTISVGVAPDKYLIKKGEADAKRNIVYAYKDLVSDTKRSPVVKKEFTADTIPF